MVELGFEPSKVTKARAALTEVGPTWKKHVSAPKSCKSWVLELDHMGVGKSVDVQTLSKSNTP